MKCEEAGAFFTMAIDDQLEPSLEQRLAEHLAGCPGCRQQYEYEERFKTLIAEKVRQVSAPDHLKSRIRTAIRATPMSASRWPRFSGFIDRYPRHIVGAMAAMLMVAVGAGLWGKQTALPLIVMELVAHHEKCNVEIATTEPEQVARWLSARGFPVAFDASGTADGIPIPMDAPRLSKLDYAQIGAHLCQILHRNAGYVVYQHAGDEVSLCFIDQVAIDLDQLDQVDAYRAPFYTVDYNGSHIVLWKDSSRLYAMIGHAPQNDLLALAAETRRY